MSFQLAEGFSATEEIDTRKYFKNFIDLFKETNQKLFGNNQAQVNNTSTYKDSEIFNDFKSMDFNITDQEFFELQTKCSINLLKSPYDEIYVKDELLSNANNLTDISNSTEAQHLNTIQSFKQSKNWTQNEKCKYSRVLKYRSENKNFKVITEGEVDLKDNNDYLIFFRLYQPFLSNEKDVHLKLFKEICCLSSNSVADLRDKIICASDCVILNDISNNPKQFFDSLDVLQLEAKELYPSSLIYLGDTLFVDTRHENCKDYAKPVLKLFENFSKEIKKNEMSDVLLRDIQNLRLGYPYVFQHQGNCEHLLVVSQARLIQSDCDSMASSDYPVISSDSIKYVRRCFLCGVKVAEVFVTECNKLLMDPTYFCKDCFISYLYVDDEKVTHFKAYLYIDDNIL